MPETENNLILTTIAKLPGSYNSSLTCRKRFRDLAYLYPPLPPQTYMYIISHFSQSQCGSFCPRVLSLRYSKHAFLHRKHLKSLFLAIRSWMPLHIPSVGLLNGGAPHYREDLTPRERVLGGVKTLEVHVVEPLLLLHCSKLKVNGSLGERHGSSLFVLPRSSSVLCGPQLR